MNANAEIRIHASEVVRLLMYGYWKQLLEKSFITM